MFVLVAVILSACGQYGDLYLPPEENVEQQEQQRVASDGQELQQTEESSAEQDK